MTTISYSQYGDDLEYRYVQKIDPLTISSGTAIARWQLFKKSTDTPLDHEVEFIIYRTPKGKWQTQVRFDVLEMESTVGVAALAAVLEVANAMSDTVYTREDEIEASYQEAIK